MNQILFSKKCIEDYEFESFKHSELIPFRIGRKPKNEETINKAGELVKQSEKEEGTS